MKRRIGLALSSVLCAVSLFAAEPDALENFDAGSTEGWICTDVLNGGPRFMMNSGGALMTEFYQQQSPFPEQMALGADQNGSAGMFVGDYISAGVTGITFRIKYDTLAASRTAIYIYSGENQWFINLTPGVAGEWTTYRIPLDYSAGWTRANASEAAFLADMQDVTWIGLRLQRNGSTSRHKYYLDDFSTPGVPPFKMVSGQVAYGGDALGTMRVLSVEDSSTWTLDTSTVADEFNAFSLQVSNLSDQYLKAFLDMDDDGVLSSWEPSGIWAGNPSVAESGDQSGALIAVSDPMSEYGIPWWWLYAHFGMTPLDKAAIPGTFGAMDTDGDGASNWAEYKAMTDPNDELSVFEVIPVFDSGNQIVWPSAVNRVYRVLRATDLASGFTVIHENIVATPPANVYTDTDTNGAGKYFYKVELEH